MHARGNVVPDAWQLQYFGSTGHASTADDDGDGLSNLKEYIQGTNPNDFFNGGSPHLTIVKGENQTGPPNALVSEPLTVKITNDQGAPYNNGAVTYLQIGGEKAPGIFDPGQSDSRRISAVQYVRFPFTPTARANFIGGGEEVSLVIDHPNYRHRTVIGGDVLAELAKDFGEDEDLEATQ